MKLEKITQPPEAIFKHSLTEQELLSLPADKAALSKDWSIANKKLDWLIGKHIELHNAFVDYIEILEGIKLFLKVTAWVVGSAGSLAVVMKWAGML